MKAAEILKKKEDSESQLGYATSISNLAAVFMKLKKFKDSEELLQAALSIYLKIVGEEHTLYAAALNNLGSLYYETGELLRSREAYLVAFGICKRKLGPSHPETVKTEKNLANLGKILQEPMLRVKKKSYNYCFKNTELSDIIIIYLIFNRRRIFQWNCCSC